MSRRARHKHKPPASVACQSDEQLITVTADGDIDIVDTENGDGKIDRPTTDLAVFYIFLSRHGTIDHDRNHFAAVRTLYFMFDQGIQGPPHALARFSRNLTPFSSFCALII
jgi:hypothetical protein